MKLVLKKFTSNLILGVTLSLLCGNYIFAQEKYPDANSTSLFPKGEKLPGKWFTGIAFLNPLVAKDKNNNFSAGSVTFEPNARANWHKHPKGQVLLVTEGEGLYQEKGKPARIIRKSDVINIPEDTEHWHGATDHSKMVHIAITNYEGETNSIWLDPVTDTEYKSANN